MHSWSRPGIVVGALALVLAMAGCSDNDNAVAPTSDDAELRALVTSNPEYADYFDLDTVMGDESGPAAAPGMPIGLSPVGTLLGWHRERERVVHTVTSEIEEGIAHVTHQATVSGELHLRAEVDGSVNAYLKPMVNVSERHATFVRRSSPQTDRPGWRLVSVSGTRVVSDVNGNPPTVAIGTITVESEGKTITITDPTVETLREELPTFTPGAEVTVTVASTGAPAVAFLHSGGRHGEPRFRVPIPSENGTTFRGTWHVPMVPGIYHAA